MNKIRREQLEKVLPSTWFDNKRQRELLMLDIQPFAEYLEVSRRYQSNRLFRAYLSWLASRFDVFNLTRKQFWTLVKELFRIVHGANLPKEKFPIDTPPHNAIQDSPLASEAREFLDALLEGSAEKALSMSLEWKHTHNLDQVYLHVFQPILYETGYLWQTGRISIATEHYITASTQYAMSQYYPDLFATPKHGGLVLAAAPGEAPHEIGIRMVADVLEYKGYRTHYLGGNLPESEIVDAVIAHSPDLIALGITLPIELTALEDVIQRIKGDERTRDIPILVGGQPFNQDPSLKEKLDADAYGENLSDAVQKAGELIDD